MKKENVKARHNFFVNGDFTNSLQGWVINDRLKVTRQTGRWEGQTIGFLYAVNKGTAKQEVELALLPRPTLGRADYKVFFLYEAIYGAECTVRITPGLGGELDYPLLPSLKVETDQEPDPDAPLADPEFRAFEEMIALDPQESTVTFEFITPKNDDIGSPRGLRVAFVRLELLLEPLTLDSVTIDQKVLAPDEQIRLCFGAQYAHSVTLQLATGSVWRGTAASWLVENEVVDPKDMLQAQPSWGQEQSIDAPWQIGCAPVDEDTQIHHNLMVRSQYTADTYLLNAVSGHFKLDVVLLQEPTYYPVIGLNQSVELRVRVESHYTRRAMANREVTWTLLGSRPEDDIVLLKVPSDANGEATYTYTPDVEGGYEIVASVDSHYQGGKYAFQGVALQDDPWLTTKFSLDSLTPFIWGSKDAYPCRGDTHAVKLAFDNIDALVGTELKLEWSGNDTPGGLGVEFTPELDTWNIIREPGLTWSMSCENRRNSEFRFRVSCSKLLEASPFQTLKLAHNKLAVEATRESTRFPVVGGPSIQLAIQIVSTVPGVGGVSEVDVKWTQGTDTETLQTGAEGWCERPFEPRKEGPFAIEAEAVSFYDCREVKHTFTGTVLGEEPWSALATVTLAGKPSGDTGLVCIRDKAPVALLIMPIGEALVDQEISLELVGDREEDLAFHVDPPMADRRKLTEDGLVWRVHSTSEVSARFQLRVLHDQLPNYELPGLLLSSTLEGEGELTFDGRTLEPESTLYPCLGAYHRLKFVPKPASPLISLMAAAKWNDPSGTVLDLTLDPAEGEERALGSVGLEWALDAYLGNESGQSGLSLDFAQVALIYPPLPVLLGHNRVEIAGIREASFDPEVGQTVFLELQVKSYYTKLAVQSLAVSFEHGGIPEVVRTGATGWASFAFTATQPGNVVVKTTASSPYDGADLSHTFHIKVLAAVARPL
ncbi:hypothetical protein [Pseudomonas sp. RT6P73]